MISIYARLMMMDLFTDFIDQFKLMVFILFGAVYNNTLYIFLQCFQHFFGLFWLFWFTIYSIQQNIMNETCRKNRWVLFTWFANLNWHEQNYCTVLKCAPNVCIRVYECIFHWTVYGHEKKAMNSEHNQRFT